MTKTRNIAIFVAALLIFNIKASYSSVDSKQVINLYYASSLSTVDKLTANVELKKAVYDISNGKYNLILPQEEVVLSEKFNIAVDQSYPKDQITKTVRDIDIEAIYSSDGIIVNLDNKAPSIGAVAEFFINRCLDKPALLFKTDANHDTFKKDKPEDGKKKISQSGPWSVMLNHYPKTSILLLDSADMYKDYMQTQKSPYSNITQHLTMKIAGKLVKKLDEIDFSYKKDLNAYSYCAKIFNFEYVNKDDNK